MTVLSAQTIRRMGLVYPCLERTQFGRVSHGLSACGYDLRSDQRLVLHPGDFVLASAKEKFQMPCHVVGIVHDKSTWARQGIALQNTVIEPGWFGFLTLEITNHGRDVVVIEDGEGIAQVVFHFLDDATDQPYQGKYQNQQSGPQEAR